MIDSLNEFISFYNLLPSESKALLFLGLCCAIITHFIYLRSKKGLIPLLSLTAILIASAFATIDPFFHTWDEAFHALVAKNASAGYLSPHLINEELFPYNYESWVGNYIWLHKPPLSLWHMAASIDLFGQNIIAVRIPSILAFATTTVFVFLIGNRLFGRRCGYYGAILFLFYQFGLEQVAGIHTADHVDVFFTLYITASFWAWITYQQEHKTVYIFLIGVFVGSAVLTKWMVGLLVFGVWGIILIALLIGRRDIFLKEFLSMLKSLGIALLVILPWNIYAAIKYPLEYWYEFHHARRHFYEVIEFHGGDGWFYWNNLSDLFGSGTLVPYIVLISFVVSVLLIKKSREQIALASFVFLPYAFFTLAATKMSNFVTIVSPVILICIAVLFVRVSEFISERIKINKLFTYLLIPFFFVFLLRPQASAKNHHFSEPWKRSLYIDKQSKIRGVDTIKEAIYFYYESAHYENIIHMFYHANLALSGLPSEKQLQKIKDIDKRLIIVYKDHLPDDIEFPAGTRFIKMPDRYTLNQE